MPTTQKNRVINQLEAVKSLITEVQKSIEDGKAAFPIAVDIDTTIVNLQKIRVGLGELEDSDGNISTEQM